MLESSVKKCRVFGSLNESRVRHAYNMRYINSISGQAAEACLILINSPGCWFIDSENEIENTPSKIMYKRKMPATKGNHQRSNKKHWHNAKHESTYSTHTHTFTLALICGHAFKLRQQHELARIAATRRDATTRSLGALSLFGHRLMELKSKLLFMLRK